MLEVLKNYTLRLQLTNIFTVDQFRVMFLLFLLHLIRQNYNDLLKYYFSIELKRFLQ